MLVAVFLGVPASSRHLAFTLEVKSKLECFFVTLMAARPTDKAIWTSDISQVCFHFATVFLSLKYFTDSIAKKLFLCRASLRK